VIGVNGRDSETGLLIAKRLKVEVGILEWQERSNSNSVSA
jgi:hypothetical protein